MKKCAVLLLLCCGCAKLPSVALTEDERLVARALSLASEFATRPDGTGPIEAPEEVKESPPPEKPRFEFRSPELNRRILYFYQQGCRPCVPTTAAFSSFVSGRGLGAGEWQSIDVATGSAGFDVPATPCIIVAEGAKEVARLEGMATFEQIEDVWLSGAKRAHYLSGVPLPGDTLGRIQAVIAMVKTASFSTTLAQQINIPLDGIGEIVIPPSVAIVAGPVSGGFRVAVATGTTAPWVRSKWMGSLYPIPITAVSVVGKKATVELRGWQDLVISLEGP